MPPDQFYVLVAIQLVGMLMKGGLFLYIASKLHALLETLGELDTRVARLEDRHPGQ